MAELLIQGGRVVDPASGFNQTADVLITDGVVAEIGRVSAARAARKIDAEGCIVAPGLIDVHVHLREPDPEHRETIATGSAAAVNGGFTSVCCMPNTRPPIDTEGLVQHVHHQGRAARKARVFAAACATQGRQGKRPAPIAGLARAGAAAFTDDGDCVADAGVMARALRTVRAAGRAFMQHCQDPALTRGGVMNAGALATRLALGGWPRAAEESILQRDVQLNRAVGCRYHAQHVSSGGSVEIIRRARADGLPVTAEVTPHHLLLTEDLCREYDTTAKVNPPLRTAADIEQIKAGVADGTITILATDHAPHPWHRKQLDFEAAAFGIVGLDCALPLYMKALVDDGVIGLEQMLAMMTVNPAALLGIDRMGLGALTVGGPADVTIIDPRLEWTIRSDEFASTGRNCPFAGLTVRGRAIAAIVAGDVRMSKASARVTV
ncbi:MAG: dihydroorotase [Planctomycetota bacterium]|jgi:dihydroorotase